MIRLTCLLAVAAAAVGIAPAAHAEDRAQGLSCGMNASNDPTGHVVQDPNTISVAMYGGPVTVANTGPGLVADVRVGCYLKLSGNDGNDGNYGPGSSTVTPGSAGAHSDSVTYHAVPGDDLFLFLCTVVSWNGPKGHTDWYVDMNPSAPGDQCAAAASLDRPGPGPHHVVVQQPIAR